MVTKVGAENYAAKLAEEARRFTLVNSPLRNDVNLIVKWVGYMIIPVGLLLASSQFLRRDEGWQDSIISTVAGLVGMVPEGLVLLTSVAFAVGVCGWPSERCLVQELPAIEVLARVDVLCVDKTGTITEGTLALAEVQPARRRGPSPASTRALAALAATRPRPERDLARAARTRITDTTDVDGDRPRSVLVGAEVERDDLRRPGQLGARRTGERADVGLPGRRCRADVEEHAQEGQRVLLLAKADGTLHRRRRRCPAAVTAGRARAARGHRPRRRTGDAASTSPTRA